MKKTNNFKIDLMIPSQPNKDVVFNESLLKLDNFLNFSIRGLTENIPSNLQQGDKFIITGENHRDEICFMSDPSKGIEFLQPQNGMVLFSMRDSSFYLYNEKKWNQLSTSSSVAQPKHPAPSISTATSQETTGDNALPHPSSNIKMPKEFRSVSGKFSLPSNSQYIPLYLDNHTQLNCDKISEAETTILIKQCWDESKTITWPKNILWENKKPHIISSESNSIDIIKLYKIPDALSFLGKIIGQNYQF